MRHHQSRKNLKSGFGRVWELLNISGEQPLATPRGHRFVAMARITIKGSHQREKVIQIRRDEQEFARIYPCCWGHTTNCYGTRIGGYSDALDEWAGQGLD
jgi:hypothetical protein